MKSKFALGAFVFITLAAALSVAQGFGLNLFWLPTAARWLAIIGLLGYAAAQRSLTTWILVGMVVGAEVGHDWPQVALNLRVLSQVFLRLIKMIVAPLLFATLVVGIAGHSDLKKVGRLGIKALVYFEIATTLALLVGLAAINLSKAGVGIQLPAASRADQLPVAKQSATDFILHIFPENIAKSVAEGQLLQIVAFSILFGIALALVSESKRQPMLRFSESLAETMFKLTNIVMLFAPIGVGAAIAYTVGNMGLNVLVNLLQLVATVYVALLVFVLFVLLPIALLARVPIRKFARAITEPLSIAFATASSEAALPRAIEAMEGMGVPRHIVAFVLPTGYSFNLEGSSLYLSLATIFVAQAAGISMTWGQQILIVLTLMLTTKGLAGVPRASLVVLLGTVASFNLPVEPVFIIVGIDQLMDMARTAVNLIGNCLATAAIARWEGELAPERAILAETVASAK